MKKILKQVQSGFTLIELLVVVGILSLLAVAALVAINPAEAQKKARDAQRIKDAATLQSIVEQFLTDNPGALTGLVTNGSNNPATVAAAKNCNNTGWVGVAFGGRSACNYANVVPVDPTNRGTVKLARGDGAIPNPVDGNAWYQIMFSAGGGYKICIRLESTSNSTKLAEDGGNATTGRNYLEVFSDNTLTCAL